MKKLRGTSLFCGIGVEIDEMREHIEKAASVGINALFTSLQLPEADKDELFRDFSIMSELAHRHGMIVEADINHRTSDIFGLDLHDIEAFKKLGVDYVRIDGAYTDEDIVKATHNDVGETIVLNAALATDDWLSHLCKLGIKSEQVSFCHNYYPMRYTGLTAQDTQRMNDVIHRYGFRVSGFLASQTHKRIGCSIGLPTLERHREMNVFTAVQESFLLGMDDLFFGDDLADISELKALSEADDEIVTIRIHPLIEGEIMDWLLDRPLGQTQNGLEMILRSNYMRSSYPGNADDTPSCTRRRGDVTICKSPLLRYSGEIQLVRKDLPMDPHIGLIGRIIDEDLPLLDIFKSRKMFKLIRD